MTDEQRETALRLERCTYLPGSFEKRFVKDMALLARNKPDYELSEKQAAYLSKVAHRYRGQLSRVPRIHP